MIINAVWDRIEAWFHRNAPEALSQFQPGASDEQISQAESAMDVRFPQDVRESYRVHNGSGVLRMFPRGRLMELEYPGNGVVYEWNFWRELLEDGTLPELVVIPDGPIKAVRWNLRWIPLTDTGGDGNHFCLDLDPAPGGRVGQIIWHHHEVGPVRLEATGFSEWLRKYASDLEAGRYIIRSWRDDGVEIAEGWQPDKWL